MAVVEPINERPPAYSEHEFLFLDESEDAENASPPGYSVPFIDPPAYEEGENPAPPPPLEEDFAPDGGLPGYEIALNEYRPHL